MEVGWKCSRQAKKQKKCYKILHGPIRQKIGPGIIMLEIRQEKLWVNHDLNILNCFTEILGQIMKDIRYIGLSKIEKRRQNIWIKMY